MASRRSSTDSEAEPEPSSTELELYRLAVEMADRVSARRGTANNFFLAVHAGVITAVAALLSDPAGAPMPLDSTFIALAGIALSAAWWLSLRSYRDLNSAKFKVILQMEARLPVAVFADEWQFLKTDPVIGWRKRYAELGQVERVVPIVFLVLYVASLVVVWWP
jgi:hypothetical protein